MYPNPLERKHSTFRQVIDKIFYPEKRINKSCSGWRASGAGERRKTAPGCGK